MMIIHCARFCVNIPTWWIPSLGTKRAVTNFLRTGSNRVSLKSSVLCVRFIHHVPFVNDLLDQKQASVITRLGISSKDCQRNPAIYNIHPITLEHHGLVLLEGGFAKVNASVITSYYKIVRRRIAVLKMSKYIKPETNVSKSFLLNLEKFPAEEVDMIHLQENEMKFIDVYNIILKKFLVWRLETTEPELNIIMKRYQRIKHKSLKYIAWSLDILEHNIGFSKEKIIKNGYLIHSYPFNTLDTLERIPVLCGRDIKSVLKQFPKITMTATDTMIDILKLLKENNISDEAVQRRFDIFTLGSASVNRRLQRMKQSPELQPFVSNPRVMQLVHYQNKAYKRINQLQELQRQCMSLHLLTAPESRFERYTQEGQDCTRGSDAVTLLSHKLNVDKVSVRKAIQRHPYWCSIPVQAILKTLDFLLQMGYKESDIFENVHLVLYPCEKVKELLSSLSSRSEIIEAQNLINTSPLALSRNKPITKNCELALCLYLLEKEHHFTGNGIWSTSSSL